MDRAGVLERWPAAVSPLTAAAVHFEPRPARVLAALPTALYLHLEGAHDDVLPLLAGDALRLPTGLRLARPAATTRWGVDQGQDVLVGGGRVRLPGADVVAVRVWRPARVADGAPLSAGDGLSADARLKPALALLDEATGSAVLRELARDVATAALLSHPAGLARLVRGLVGAGRGLTPSGDDALCGILLGLRAAGAPTAHERLASAVRHCLGATTSLSASLLRAAAEGHAVPEVVTAVEALARADATALGRALPGVLAIGHSSGADLLAGLAGSVDALLRADPSSSPSSSRSSDHPHPQPEGARRA